jgi:glutamate synthase (NADPH/NADH) small chain
LGKHGSPVQTGALEKFAVDYQRQVGNPVYPTPETNGHRVAIVGAGPSGLAAAESLALKGYEVTLFDAKPQPGGLLLYGIPNFKLQKDVLLSRIDDILRLGVKFVGETFIGRDKTIDDLFADGFEAVFIAIGTWVEAPMKAEGVDLPGVYNGTEFLIRFNVNEAFLPDELKDKPDLGNKVVVIGGGDTAADCLRTSLRMGIPEVTCLYRRTEAEMPGGSKDRKLARDEGARYEFLTQPKRFIANQQGRLSAVECVRMQLGDPDESGRRRPVEVPGSEFLIEADTAVLALGYWPDDAIAKSTPDLETHDWGLITADRFSQATSRPGVFAGGDAVTGPDLVVTAMAAGQRAAQSIDAYILGL